MSTPGPVEVELKYRVRSVVSGERLLNAEILGPFTVDGPTRISESEDRYVDTRDGALGTAGYAARLRRERGTTIISVKSLATTAGALQRRTEIEGPADRTLAPSDWPSSAARSFILELCGDAPLMELVTLRQTRRKRPFRDGETVVELSLDEVEVIARAQLVDRFTEIEFELRAGPEAPLVALAGVLAAEADLTPSHTSKFEAALAATRPRRGGRGAGVREARSARGVATPAAADVTAPADANGSPAATGADIAAGADAAADTTATADAAPATDATGDSPTPAAPAGTDAAPSGEAEPRKERRAKRAAPDASAASAIAGLAVGRTPGVTADDTVAEAGRKVLRFHLARLIAREAGTRSGEDPEELHAMRVATRRMRAAWRVFGDGYRQDGTRKFRNRLRDVARKLGAVRDIDVLVIALEEYRATLPEREREALEPLLDDWRAQREAGRVVLTRELDSDGYRQFVDDYRTFVMTPGAGARAVSPTQPHHVRDTAGSHIWLAYEQVLAYGPVLRWADVPTLHQLRIAGKWLRYTLEFVAEAAGPDAAPLIEKVVAMQDHLGLMNDAEVAALKARSLLVTQAGTLTHAQTVAIAKYLTSCEREVARLKRLAPGPWRAVASPVFRARLGRTLARLATTTDGSHTA